MTGRPARTATGPTPTWAEIAAVVALAAVALFFRVHIPPVYQWDEARLALNALEMMHNPNPLIVTYNGEADLWNSKPPLAVWLSAVSMRLFGVNELALRIPAVLAAVGTVLAVYLFARRVSGSRATALLAALILLGTGGYYQIHVARTADFDSLLVLFTTLATFRLFFAFQALGTADHRPADFYAAAAFVVGGLYAKGVGGLLMVPGYLLYLVGSGRIRAFVECRAAWLSGVLILASAVLFLVAREAAEPGYAQAVWGDTAFRFGTVLDGHVGYGHYYLAGLLWPWQLWWGPAPGELSTALSAFPWSWLLPFAALFGILSSHRPTARASAYLSCCLIAFLVLISTADMKLPWYVAPAFPLMAALAALGIGAFANRMLGQGAGRLRSLGKATLPASLLLGVASVAANLAKTERALTPVLYPVDRQLEYFVRSFVRDNRHHPKLRIVRLIDYETPAVADGEIVGTERYDGAVEFYARQLRREGTDVEVVDLRYAPRPGDVIIGCGEAFRSAYRPLAVVRKENRCLALGNRATATTSQAGG